VFLGSLAGTVHCSIVGHNSIFGVSEKHEPTCAHSGHRGNVSGASRTGLNQFVTVCNGELIMTYLGERLLQCNAVPFNWAHTHLIVVSGSGPNLCGHAIINAGLFYFHVDGINDYPHYMPEVGYRRYLRENGKHELLRRHVPLKNPAGAQQKLEELSARRWRWMIIPHNCASYVEEIFAAGGSDESILTNCPVQWK
jgi:hypothetical protein